MVGGERIEVTVTSLDDVDAVRAILDRYSPGEVQNAPRSRVLSAPISGGTSVFREVLRAIEADQTAVYDLGLRRPTLDDVFLSLTGRAAESAGAPEVEEVGT